MKKLPAKTGWLWIKEGIFLFRRQPAEISTLFLGYMLLILALGMVPVIGQLLPLLLVPVFAMSFMQACRDIEEDRRVYPNLLLSGFRSPALRTLLVLGVLYLLAAFGAVRLSALVDGGAFWNAMTGAGQTPRQAGLNDRSLAIVAAAVIYTPAAMAFWFAAPLIAWHGMPLGKSLFYSFFAVLRAGKAFVVYAAAWLVIGILLPATISVTVALLINSTTAVFFMLLPLSILSTIVMYCSFYPTYTTVFGRPQRDGALFFEGDDSAG